MGLKLSDGGGSQELSKFWNCISFQIYMSVSSFFPLKMGVSKTRKSSLTNTQTEDISFSPRNNMSNFQLPLSALCFVLEDSYFKKRKKKKEEFGM